MAIGCHRQGRCWHLESPKLALTWLIDHLSVRPSVISSIERHRTDQLLLLIEVAEAFVTSKCFGPIWALSALPNYAFKPKPFLDGRVKRGRRDGIAQLRFPG